ncbi:MAG: STAS/SEC14 domain-containing protein [Sphingomonas sp.]
MMTFEIDDAGLIEFTVDGEITRREYDEAVVAMEALIARHGHLSAVTVIRSFAGMELAAWWRDISWGVGHMAKVRRVAVVTDVGWLATLAEASGHLLPMQLKRFKRAEIDAARGWARAG